MNRLSNKRATRKFNAGQTPGYLSGWTTYQYGTINDEIRFDLVKMRSRSRDASVNDNYARRYFQAIKTNVVGPNGIQTRMKVRDMITQVPDVIANNKIEQAWNKWQRSVTPDGLNWVQLQQLVVETAARDGEVIIQFLYGNEYPHGLALQVMEADHLDEQYERTQQGDENRVIAGVELTEVGKVVAYHLWKYHPATQQRAREANIRLRVPATNAIHLFLKERPGQLRGFPWLAPALQSLEQIKEYTTSELVAARVAAAKMGFYTRPRGEEYTGDGDDEVDENAVIGEVEPGIMEILPEGYGVEMFNPTHPTTAFGDFIKVILRGVAASVGISYHTLASDLESASYSSLRQGAIDERETYFTLQRWFIEMFVRPVFEKWLEMALLRQDITLPLGGYDKFNAPEFRPRAFQLVDAQKEINALATKLQYSLTSRTDVCRALGREFSDVVTEISQEEELMDRLGVDDVLLAKKLEGSLPSQGNPSGVDAKEDVEEDV